jgi:hypothetical protein
MPQPRYAGCARTAFARFDHPPRRGPARTGCLRLFGGSRRELRTDGGYYRRSNGVCARAQHHPSNPDATPAPEMDLYNKYLYVNKLTLKPVVFQRRLPFENIQMPAAILE